MPIEQVAQQQENPQQDCNKVSRSNNPLWIKDTSNCCTIKCRIRVILNWHRSTRSIAHQKLSDGNNTNKQITNQNPHGLNKWQKHCNKNWIFKESKTYWLEVPLHTTAGTQRHTIGAQNRYRGQHCRHIHKICHSRSPEQTLVQRWAFEPQQQLTLSSRQSHKQVSQACIQKQQQQQRDACTIHTSVVDAMVSQSDMGTISTISFWTSTIRWFPGWWQVVFTIFFFAWISTIVEVDKFEWNNFCCTDFTRCFKTILFVWPPQQFLLKNNLRKQSCRSQEEQWRFRTTRLWRHFHPEVQSPCLTTRRRFTMWQMVRFKQRSWSHKILTSRGTIWSKMTRPTGLQWSQKTSTTLCWTPTMWSASFQEQWGTTMVGNNWFLSQPWKKP